MPNTVTLNSGTGGERLTTDQIIEAGVTAHAQYVKILSGSAASSAAIGGTLAQGLMVDVTRVGGALKVTAVADTALPFWVATSADRSVLVSGVGLFTVGGIVTVVPSPQATFFVATSVDRAVDVSADPGATFFVATSVDRAVDVSADPSATFFIATSVDRNISVSAQGALSIPVTVANVVSVSAAANAPFSVSAAAGVAIPVSADPSSTFFVATSGDRYVCSHPNLSGSASPMSANGTFNPLKYVYINASAAGDLTLVASTAGRSIRVLGYAIICPNSALPVFFQDTEATTLPKIHAAFTMVTGGGVSYAGSIYAPAFQTTVGAGLELKRGATSDAIVQGHLSYIEVTN